jgi:hypothetical protein
LLTFCGVHATSASAEPGTCTLAVTGCTRLYFLVGPLTPTERWNEYRLNSSDANLFNNFYQYESCFGGCSNAGLMNVADEIQNYKLNVPGKRFCRYAGTNYSTALGWITQPDAWYSASGYKGQSIKFTNNTKC